MTLALLSEAMPTVATNAARDARFPSPSANQIVWNLALGVIQQWDGAAWNGIVLPGGSVGSNVDGFFQDNVAASQTAAILSRVATAAFATKWIAPRAGSILGVSVKTNDVRTAGTLTVEVYVEGVGTGLTAVLDGSNTEFKATVQAGSLDTFIAADEIDVRITTDSGWLPTTADVRAAIEVLLA